MTPPGAATNQKWNKVGRGEGGACAQARFDSAATEGIRIRSLPPRSRSADPEAEGGPRGCGIFLVNDQDRPIHQTRSQTRVDR
jgi:hypothetical protein